MVHHDWSTRWNTTMVQQDGVPWLYNKMEHHFLATRWRTTVFQQDCATWLLNKTEHHCRSTRWRTATFPHRSYATFTQRYPKKSTGRTGPTEWHPHSPDLLAPTVRPQFAAAHHGGGKGGQHCAATNTVELECRWNTCSITKAADIERQAASCY